MNITGDDRHAVSVTGVIDIVFSDGSTGKVEFDQPLNVDVQNDLHGMLDIGVEYPEADRERDHWRGMYVSTPCLGQPYLTLNARLRTVDRKAPHVYRLVVGPPKGEGS